MHSQPWITWDYDTSKVYSVQLQDIEGSFTHMFAANVVPPNIGSAANTLLFPYFPPLVRRTARLRPPPH